MTTTATLAEGSTFAAKRMQASEGTSFPRHKASLESVLVVTAGRCLVRYADRAETLEVGDIAVIPADDWHQVEADPDFVATHVMPREIRFTFSA